MDTLSDFDRPVFKILPRNNSGQSKGNQSGILIPEALDAYFPQLSTELSAEHPTSDQEITAILIAEGKHIETVQTRYQYQTRSGERTIERRITGISAAASAATMMPIKTSARIAVVGTENSVRVDDVMESPKLTE